MQSAIQILSHNVKAYRLLCGMTQKKLASKSGLTQSSISALEKERLNPTLKHISAIAKAMDCEATHLLDPEFVSEFI